MKLLGYKYVLRGPDNTRQLRLTVETGRWWWKKTTTVQGSGTVWHTWPAGNRLNIFWESVLSDMETHIQYKEDENGQ